MTHHARPAGVPSKREGDAVTATVDVPLEFPDPDALTDALRDVGYLPGSQLATAAWLALRLDRPLFCEGEPGAGKTSLAGALAAVLGGRFIRLQCHDGLDASQALYDWDFPRQLMHLRALQATTPAGTVDVESAQASVYTEEYLLDRPVLAAVRASRPGQRAVLLVDEIDRADDEFEALLLEFLEDGALTIPELGTVRPGCPPLVVVTSNHTREVHDALKRRCLYHRVDLPSRDEESAIVRLRLPDAEPALAAAVVDAVARLRDLPLAKRPGVSETLDWLRALSALGVRELRSDIAAATLGAVVKHHEDGQVVASSEWFSGLPS